KGSAFRATHLVRTRTRDETYAPRVAITILDPLLSDAAADRMVEQWHAFGSYGQYSNEGFDTAYAPDLAQRYDAAANFVRSGGRFGRKNEPPAVLAARTNYFRETYSYGDDVFLAGIEAFRDDDSLAATAPTAIRRPTPLATTPPRCSTPTRSSTASTASPETTSRSRP